jgi:hypothetical protein
MSSFEIVPILSGLLLGAFLGWMNPGSRLRIGLPIALALGFLATVASGEFRISWGFLIEDIPLVGVSAAIGFFAGHRVGGLGWEPLRSGALRRDWRRRLHKVRR